jgi:membrane-bound lytic murein transglycosylase B
MKWGIGIGLAMALLAKPLLANTQSFEQWRESFKQQALSQGINLNLLNQAFASVYPDPRIIRLDRKQPEGTLTLDRYLANTVTPSRVEQGRALYQRHKMLLDEIGTHYGVPPSFIVALWGIETSYGQNTGGFHVVEALATLAYDGRRHEYFRGELLNALKIVQDGHISLAAMQGSWAGAMGQSQFMPSSFLSYAVDYNRDGRKDIWNTQADVFASIANYLKTIGWDANLNWGEEVRTPPNFDRSQAGAKSNAMPLSHWVSQGVTGMNGDLLAIYPQELPMRVFFPGDGARAYLVTENYMRLLDWNYSSYFASAVGILSDRIGE